jgi:hypothetical protein
MTLTLDIDNDEDRLHFPVIGVPVPVLSKDSCIDARSLPTTLMLGGDPVDMQYLGSFYKSMPARLLEANLNLNVLRMNTLLHKDAWELLDRRVVEISADVMNAIADLRALGLTTQLGGLGVLVSQYEQVSDRTDVAVNMTGKVDDEEDRLNFPLIRRPAPCDSLQAASFQRNRYAICSPSGRFMLQVNRR